MPARAALSTRTDERSAKSESIPGRHGIQMRYLSTVYVRNHRARVRHRRGSLLVTSPDGSQRVPLEAIDALVMLGGGQITTQALEACVRRGVRVSALRSNGAVRFVVGHATGGNVHLRIALYGAVTDPDHSLALSKAIVAAKLQNSRKVVGRWARDEKDPSVADRLASRSTEILARVPRLVEADSGNHIRGIEGDAARIYFGGVRQVVSKCGFEFSARTRRPPRDPVNAMLGFCYGLLVTEFTGAIESVGLDYQMGFFHRPRSGDRRSRLTLPRSFGHLRTALLCRCSGVGRSVRTVSWRRLGVASISATKGGRVSSRLGSAIRKPRCPTRSSTEASDGGRFHRFKPRSWRAISAAISRHTRRLSCLDAWMS